MKLETKDAGTGAIQDVDTTGKRIVLYAAHFDTLDSHNDRIRHGSFTKTIAENYSRIRHLWQHDTDKPVGRPESIAEDQKGLLVTSKISDTTLGRDLLTLVADGVMTENSIGFYTIKATNDEQKGERYIQEVKLFEYSSVTWASNENATNIGIKSLTPREQFNTLSKEFKKIQKTLRGGNFHDDTYALLEIKVAQLESEIDELFEKSLAIDAEPVITTTPEIIAEPVDYKALVAVFKNAIK